MKMRVVHGADVLERLLERPISLSVCSRNPEVHLGLASEETPLIRRSSSHASMSFGRGASLVLAGTTPSFFSRSSVSARTWSQPSSYLPLYLSAHSFGT